MRFKYIIYVEGHAAASRYASMMKMGSVILKVESRTKARDIWYFPLLKPWEDHVPVKHDLSDLAEKIEWCKANDDKCKEIAQRAGELFDRCISKVRCPQLRAPGAGHLGPGSRPPTPQDGIMDYLQLLCAEVSSRYNSILDIPSTVRHFSLGHPFNMAYAEVRRRREERKGTAPRAPALPSPLTRALRGRRPGSPTPCSPPPSCRRCRHSSSSSSGATAISAPRRCEMRPRAPVHAY